MALANGAPPLPGVSNHEESEDDSDDSESSISDVETVNTEEEYEVEDILAERENPEKPGTLQFLVKWENYPLADATWEPRDHIRDLYDDWLENKANIQAGKKEAFDVQEYYDAVAKAQGVASEKHDDSLSDSEDGEAMEVDWDADFGLDPEPKSQRVIRQTMFRGIPTPRPSHELLPKAQPNRPLDSSRKVIDRSESGIPPKLRPQVATATGYKGTARPPTQTGNQVKSATVSTVSSAQAKQPTQQASGTPKTFSGPGTKPPPPLNPRAQSPPKSSSLKTKMAGKAVAKRSKPPTSIFIGSNNPRKPKPNSSGSGLIVNPENKTPTQYTRWYQNKTRKKGIEMNETAPADISQIPKSFLISSDKPHQPPVGANVQAPSVSVDANISKIRVPFTQDDDESLFCASPDIVDPDIMETPPEEVRSPITNLGPEPIEDRPARKSSLRTMNTFETDLRPKKKVRFDQPTPLNENHQPVDIDSSSRVIVKGCTFGQAKESRDSNVPVKFVGISENGRPWFRSFLFDEKLNFEVTCSVRDFMTQRHMLYADTPLEGTLEGKAQANSPLLSNVAKRLRMNAVGLCLRCPEYSILLYPSGMSEWDGVASPPNAPPTPNTENEAPLRCVIFKSTLNHAVSQPIKVLDNQGFETTALVELLKRSSDLDFSRLKPYHVEGEGKQSYMLVIPSFPTNLSRVIQDWLRDCQPNCEVFTSDTPGSFIQAVNQTPIHRGTAIFHESVINSIRKMPKIDEMIRRGWTFWNLAIGQHQQPPTAFDEQVAIYEPGKLSMTRLFPHGKAFLITPSFVVSDPKGLSVFLNWFKDNYRRPGYVMVTCADFLAYLRDVALGKIQEQENESRLEARARAYQIMTEVQDSSGESDLISNERKVEPASDFIHPDDEQSLVNWFLWWSTTRLNRHRDFVVLGSHQSMKLHAHRAQIRIPNYSAETINDPDRGASNAKKAIPKGPKGPYQLPRSESDKSAQLRDDIVKIERCQHSHWVRIHAMIVSWLNDNMANHFGDRTRHVYDTFSDWLKAGRVFSQNNRKFTWFGLFNTIDGDWDPVSPASSYGRHPWIAIWRPRDPHLPTHSGTELLIWDISADWSSTSEQRDPYPRKMRQMQRHLIDFVRKELFSSMLPLERVWVSSEMIEEVDRREDLLDQTTTILYRLFTDSWSLVAAKEDHLKAKGWRQLDTPPMERYDLWKEFTKPAPPKPISPKTSSEGPPMQLRKHPRDADEPVRMIWHPPRRATIQEPKSSRYSNKLYEAAAQERYNNRSSDSMRFEFMPTLEWYSEQCEEGRGSSFVRVETGQDFMAKQLSSGAMGSVSGDGGIMMI